MARVQYVRIKGKPHAIIERDDGTLTVFSDPKDIQRIQRLQRGQYTKSEYETLARHVRRAERSD